MLRSPPTRLLLVAAGVVGLDQALKVVVASSLDLFQVLVVIPGLVNLTYIRNPGAAFGLLSDLDPALAVPILVGATALAVGVLGYLYVVTPSDLRWTRCGIALVFGGAIGNLIDRVRLRAVIDFIDLFWGHYHWPAFNLADTAITIGVAFILLETLLRRQRAVGG